MAQPVAAYENARTVIGLDPIAGREIGDAVRPHDLPIGTGQNASFQPRTLDPATEDVDHASFAIGCLPEMSDLTEIRMDVKDRRL